MSCIQEGWSSILHWNGTQHRMATFVRTDGNAETSMGLAVRSSLLPACLPVCLLAFEQFSTFLPEPIVGERRTWLECRCI